MTAADGESACESPAAPSQDLAVDAAEAWKAVSLVNDWVKHAEAKSAATLAAAGVLGGVLYNLIKSQTHYDRLMLLAAPLGGVLVATAVVCAIAALWPRLAASDEPTSTLYFDHIARRHPDSPAGYIEELRSLFLSPDELLRQLGQQVWANARVARHKYRWAGHGLQALFGATAAIGLVVVDLALKSV